MVGGILNPGLPAPPKRQPFFFVKTARDQLLNWQPIGWFPVDDGDGGAAVHPPLRAPNRARIRGAIDGGAIKLIKRVRSVWFHRDYAFSFSRVRLDRDQRRIG
jgi:hypothetical protein